MDMQAVAYEITGRTPTEAAAKTVELIKAVLALLPPGRRSDQFFSAFRMEMLKMGFRIEFDPNLCPFYKLEVGAVFKTTGGKLFRKIEPVAFEDQRDGLTLYLEAFDLEANRAVFINGSEIVEKLPEEFASQEPVIVEGL